MRLWIVHISAAALRHRNAGFQARNRLNRAIRAVHFFFVAHRHGQPQLRPTRKLELLRSHTDNRVGHANNSLSFDENVRIGTEAALPQPVADHDDLFVADLLFFG